MRANLVSIRVKCTLFREVDCLAHVPPVETSVEKGEGGVGPHGPVQNKSRR